VAKVAPSLTYSNDKDELVGVKYDRLNILLINAIKEQQKEIEQLRQRVRQLEQKHAVRRRSF